MPAKRALVTGCGGFVGRVITGILRQEGFDTWGIDRKGEAEDFAGIVYRSLDLNRLETVSGVLDEGKPDYIIHLAAQSSAGRSFHEPLETISNNVLPILYILEYLRTRGSKARLLAVGSADVYGPVEHDELPLRESRPPNPVSPYALSKSIQEDCCRQYAALYGVEVVVTRSFNHTGEGQADTFVLSSFARQVVEISKGLREPVIEVGNIEVRRDFLDVRDVGRAYLALLESGRSGEIYNVCSGVSHSLKKLADKLCSLAGVEVEIRVKEDRLRPVDIKELVGDNAKINADTGWKPKVSIEATLRSLLDYWSEKIEN